MLEHIAAVLCRMAEEALAESPGLPLVFSGGVMSNSILREDLSRRFRCAFASPEFSADNAAGVARQHPASQGKGGDRMAAGFQVLTVTQLCRYVKSLLEEQRQLGDVLVKGEVTNLAYRQSSGHLYFSIRDEGGLIRCVMFSRYVQSLPELPEEGALVLVRGRHPLRAGRRLPAYHL